MEICETLNIKLWERKINFETINQKRLNYFNISDKKDYILLIKTNINNPDKLNEIYKLYKNNQIIASEELEASEKQKQELLYINSISKINTNITIRLLLSSDSDNALKLYKEYKQDDNLNDYISDYILKNQIYGIFINNNLIGCAIINTKLFIIDDNDNKKLTYYIQEIFITNDFKNMKYGEKLFNYILNKCPSNLKYISFMTNVDNKAMYKIAEKNNFILQKKSSGDINNTSLFIFKIV
jgi:predicted acetyltransferase